MNEFVDGVSGVNGTTEVLTCFLGSVIPTTGFRHCVTILRVTPISPDIQKVTCMISIPLRHVMS